jgi:hypothetical protein
MRQRQRFEWFAERMSRWVGYYEVAELERFVSGSAAWPGQREKALVLLAMTDSEKARETLQRLDLDAEDDSFRALHEIAVQYAEGQE